MDKTLMQAVVILNDPPYGSERSYNGLRLAATLAKQDSNCSITIFLMANAVSCAKKGQKTPDGYYNIERMLKRFTLGAHRVLIVRHLYGCAWIDRRRSGRGRSPQHDGRVGAGDRDSRQGARVLGDGAERSRC